MSPRNGFNALPRRTVSSACATFLGLVSSMPLWAQELNPRDIAARARPAVVVVTALARGQAVGQGSGFFVSADGRLVTNHHVVEGADQLRVELATGEVYDRVFYVSADARRDLVILRIPASGVTALAIGDEREIEVGDPVYVIGNPMGLDGTFSNGLVSAKRMVEGVSLIQISAPISPGSSGGPVLNAAGEVVGVATSTLRSGQNLNMAVPSRYAADLLAINEQPKPFEDVASQIQVTAASETDAADQASADLEPWAQVLLNEMALMDSGAGVLGMVATHEPVIDLIDENATYTFDLTFHEPGATVTVTGVCDIDCRDLDLAIYDGHGRSVAEDTELDDRPVVQFVVLQPGRFSVRVHMVTCSREPCAFAVQAYSGPDRPQR